MTSTSSFRTLQAQVSGMDCGSCARTIEASLRQLPGVAEAKVSFATERLSVTYDEQQVNETAIFNRVAALGYTLETIPDQPTQVQAPSTQTLQKRVGNIDCGGCAKTIAANL